VFINPPPTIFWTPLSVQIRIPVLFRIRNVVGAELRVDLSLVLAAREAIMPRDVVQEAGTLAAAGALASDNGFIKAVILDLAMWTRIV
jgi:hypothetical protein